jgi:hypothetical protein
MLVIWLLAKNYRKKQKKILPNKKLYKIKFFILFFLINSIPLVIITETGKSIKRISDPFLAGNNVKKRRMVKKFIINKVQLRLKVLLTPIVSADLKIIESTVLINMQTKTQMNFVCV